MQTLSKAPVKSAKADGRKHRFVEPVVFLGLFVGLSAALASVMGATNLVNTLLNTAYRLFLDTVLYLLGITVLMGALSALLVEFGVADLLNVVLSPLMKPLYGLPGACALGIVTTYLSDNPAILTLTDSSAFCGCLKNYQLPVLTNLGSAFGMGMIVTTFMLSLGPGYGWAVLVGNLGAVVGSVISTRMLLHFSKKRYGVQSSCAAPAKAPTAQAKAGKAHRTGRVLSALLDGGKAGLDMGISIIPGVLIICTLVLLLTNGPSEAGVYTGAAYEGVGLLPWLGARAGGLLHFLFGFTDSSSIAVPITAMGAAGAAIGLVPGLVDAGAAGGGDIAVFTAMCICWGGYLSTHVGMMASLGYKELTGKAILAHTIGGLCAGVAANWIYQGLALIVL